eukprot:2622708-Pyramimonas_sp.AAC.1
MSPPRYPCRTPMPQHYVWWACAQQSTRHHPRRPCQKPCDSDRRMTAHDPDLAARDGSPAHSRESADTPAVL